MNRRRRTSIRARLLRFALVMSVLTLLVTGTLFTLNDLQMLRAQMIRDLQVLAAVVGDGSLGALSFDAPESAAQNLALLRREPQVRQAVLFDAEGQVFASYRGDPTDAVAKQAQEPVWRGPGVHVDVSMLGLGQIIVARELMLNGERLGGILIIAETVELAAQIPRYLLAAGSILILSLALTLTIALRLQRRIATPIRDLAETTRAIGTRGDYALRVHEPDIGDEIAELYRQFNNMLDQVQRRDQALARMQASLEKRVSEQTKELRDLLREQTLILEALPLGVIHLVDRMIVRANPRAAELLGWEGEEMLGLGSESVYAHPEDHAETGRVVYATLAEGIVFRGDLLLRRKDGSTFWGRLIGQALDPERPMHESIWIVDNIDADKALEARLQQARTAAEEANRAKDAFMANMSHELRTPLGSVLGFAQILESDHGLNDRQREQLQGIRRGAERLLGLIEDLLDLASIEAGRVELIAAPWSTRAFFQELTGTFGPKAQAKGLGLRVSGVGELPTRLCCDQRRLHQVVSNLIDNAIKYTQGGEVWVAAAYSGADLCLEVGDTGVGIDAADTTQIFEPFQQLQARGTTVSGVGLGLAIVNRLVDCMGGTISVDSAPGGGSRFVLRIPAERVSDDDFGAKDTRFDGVTGYERIEGQGSLRILIVDDEAQNRQVLVGMLKPLGFRVREAIDGRDCLHQCADWRPDLILMDLRMPVMGGMEATRALRADESTRLVPLVAVTAAAFSEDRTEALEAGCNAFLAKPLMRSTLLQTLATLLPLRWLHAASPQENAAEARSSAPERLPEEDLETLARLVQQGDIGAIGALGEALTQRSACPTLAKRLSRLAARFDIAGLRALVAELKPRAADIGAGSPRDDGTSAND